MVRHANAEYCIGTSDGIHCPVTLVNTIGVIRVGNIRVGETAGNGVGIQCKEIHQRALPLRGIARTVFEITIRHIPAVGQAAIEIGVIHLEFATGIARPVASHVTSIVVVTQHHVERQLYRLKRFFEFFRKLGIIHAGDPGLINVIAQPDHQIAPYKGHVTDKFILAVTDIGYRLPHGILTRRAAAGISNHNKAYRRWRVADGFITAAVIRVTVPFTTITGAIGGFHIAAIGTGIHSATGGASSTTGRQGNRRHQG